METSKQVNANAMPEGAEAWRHSPVLAELQPLKRGHAADKAATEVLSHQLRSLLEESYDPHSEVPLSNITKLLVQLIQSFNVQRNEPAQAFLEIFRNIDAELMGRSLDGPSYRSSERPLFTPNHRNIPRDNDPVSTEHRNAVTSGAQDVQRGNPEVLAVLSAKWSNIKEGMFQSVFQEIAAHLFTRKGLYSPDEGRKVEMLKAYVHELFGEAVGGFLKQELVQSYMQELSGEEKRNILFSQGQNPERLYGALTQCPDFASFAQKFLAEKMPFYLEALERIDATNSDIPADLIERLRANGSQRAVREIGNAFPGVELTSVSTVRAEFRSEALDVVDLESSS